MYDANGKEFLIRGVNSEHLWFDGWNRYFALKSLPFIAKTNSNLNRIVWSLNSQKFALQLTDLDKIINKTIELKMIPMIELHDATSSSNVTDLLDCARWFRDNINLFKKYQKYILINIANEWVNNHFLK